MEAIVEKVIEGLGSLAIEELKILGNFKDDVDNMKSMVSAIKAVLRDAEAKATNHQVSDWLEKLKDVLLDADDLLDDFIAEALAREVMTKNKMAKEVRIFFSKSNQVAYALKMGHKIKAIRKRLDEIVDVKNKLQLSDCHSSNSAVESREWRQTYSFVGEDEVVGREEEKKTIVSYLLDTNVEDSVSIVPIVGIGGLGKTALAQLVYNDKAVQDHFELKMWVCVSEEFGIRQIAQKIIGHSTDSYELDGVVHDLKMKIEGKRFLLVLDDVWNEDREIWLKLKSLLGRGAKGSMIIVTTRSMEVANIMGTHGPIPLEGLDLDKCWKLFCRVAFKEGKEPNNTELAAIGKDIVTKCVGLPLVIRTIGSLLFSKKLEVSEWSYFRDRELPKIDTVEDKVFAMLKLSYDHLSSDLKNCFGYCSLFPKYFEIKRKEIIQLWAAQGFILSEGSRLVEDIGDEYFMKLLSMCLFQDVQLDELGEIRTCKMHDLIHDLARSVTKNEYFVLSEGKDNNWGDKMRHLSFEFQYDWKFPTSVVNGEKIRTILSPISNIEIIPSHLPPLLSLYERVGGSAISFPRRLRVLAWYNSSHCQIPFLRKIPKSIFKLKHLRYLDLSGNGSIKKLPQGITKLHNLQTLKLNDCWEFKRITKRYQRNGKSRAS